MTRATELSTGLLTDLYQLTMAQAYFSSGMTEDEACFHLFFRENPFDGGYAVACGLQQAIDHLESLRFTDEDIAYLSGLSGSDNGPLFTSNFLRWLSRVRLHL